MAEPSSSSAGLVAVSVALLGPVFGEYGLIVFAALAGSLWALGKRQSSAPLDGALFLLKIIFTAVVLSGFVAHILATRTSMPSHQLLAPVAFCIGFFGNSWSDIGELVLDRVVKRFGSVKK